MTACNQHSPEGDRDPAAPGRGDVRAGTSRERVRGECAVATRLAGRTGVYSGAGVGWSPE